MATLSWMKQQFSGGYDSGDILFPIPGRVRRGQERIIGGSYKRLFYEGILPHLRPDATVLEMGPGKGSWTRAVLKYLPAGHLTAIDFQDTRPWLKPEKYNGRLTCVEVTDNSFALLEDNSFDFLFSIGVLCHHGEKDIREVLSNSLPKMKKGGIALHHHGDWNKLEAFGWNKGNVPVEFKAKPDDEIWWPRNNTETMTRLAREAGWSVLVGDLDLVKRDSIILLKADQRQTP